MNFLKKLINNKEEKENLFELHEKIYFGLTTTFNEEFDRNGYLVIRNFWNPDDFREEIVYESGHFLYNQFGKCTQTKECQVPGSRARHGYPPYKYFHSQLRMKIEKIIGKELFNTYFYDRVYFSNQELTKHVDREVCEISVTFQIGSNCKKPWPIWIKSPDIYDENGNIVEKGKDNSICLNDGDAVLYKGCERPHWRNPLKSRYNLVERGLQKLLRKKDDTYHHQIFFHYVLADGKWCSFAGSK